MALPTLERRGLSARLFVIGALAALLVSALGGWALRQSVQDSLYKSFAQRLDEKAQRLIADLHLLPDGSLILSPGRNNDEFGRIFSGWYWQLESGGGEILGSRSLWDTSLNTRNARPLSRELSLQRLPGPQEMPLIGNAYPVEIDEKHAVLY
ncbi:MAG: hypothetical protein F9K30_16455, partial [Dechloromonas sp.]